MKLTSILVAGLLASGLLVSACGTPSNNSAANTGTVSVDIQTFNGTPLTGKVFLIPAAAGDRKLSITVGATGVADKAVPTGQWTVEFTVPYPAQRPPKPALNCSANTNEVFVESGVPSQVTIECST
jgi:hypothetical protein